MTDKILKGYITNTSYIWQANKGACSKCTSLNNKVYTDKKDIPQPPHPNCKCQTKKIPYTYKDRKNDTDYHEILKQAAIYSYHKKEAEFPEEYSWGGSFVNPNTGFYADVLVGKDDVIISYRGSDEFYFRNWHNGDFDDDFAMARSRIPEQTRDALDLYNKVKNEYPEKSITLTGHSLGGSLADIVGALTGELAVSFNAYGVGDIFSEGTNINDENIVNYTNIEDIVTVINGENHIGETYTVPNTGNGLLGKHNAEGMGKLSKREKITKKEIKDIADKKFRHHKIVKEKIVRTADKFEKMEKLRNKIKQKLEEEELQRLIKQRFF